MLGSQIEAVLKISEYQNPDKRRSSLLWAAIVGLITRCTTKSQRKKRNQIHCMLAVHVIVLSRGGKYSGINCDWGNDWLMKRAINPLLFRCVNNCWIHHSTIFLPFLCLRTQINDVFFWENTFTSIFMCLFSPSPLEYPCVMKIFEMILIPQKPTHALSAYLHMSRWVITMQIITEAIFDWIGKLLKSDETIDVKWQIESGHGQINEAGTICTNINKTKKPNVPKLCVSTE